MSSVVRPPDQFLGTLMLLLCIATGCRGHVSPMDRVAWDFDPVMVEGEILVAPVLVLAEVPDPDLTGRFGEDLHWKNATGRLQRTAQLAELPYSVHAALPGALYRSLPPDWEGHFRDMRLSLPQQIALTQGLKDPGRSALSLMVDVAKAAGGDAVLFSWVIEAEGTPLTDEFLVGELVVYEGLPVIVDHTVEPYAVEALVGMALITQAGELVFRYQDRYSGLLTGDGPDELGRAIARDLVADIAPIWRDVEADRALAER